MTGGEAKCRLCNSNAAEALGYCRQCAQGLRRQIFKAVPTLRAQQVEAETERQRERWSHGHLRRQPTVPTGSRQLNNYLFTASELCPICDQNFPLAKVNWSRLQAESHAADFYTRYREFSPYPYSVWVCGHCGYAAPPQAFNEITILERQAIKEAFGGRQPVADFSGLRDFDLAVSAYKLGLFTTRFRRQRYGADLIQGALLLRLAWLYREKEAADDESNYLRAAAAAYLAAYEGDAPLTGGMTRIKLEYLIGELYRRTGDTKAARVWLGRVVGRRDIGREPAIAKLARAQWQLMREAEQDGSA